MPCSDGGYTREQEIERERAAEKERRMKEASRRVDLLCSACRALERMGYDFDENPELSRWWAGHKKEDAARLAAEEAKAQREAYQRRVIEAALAKPIGELTEEEKKLLRQHKYL